jgi:amino acid transporter
VTLFFAGQAPVLFQMPEPIDEATPKEAHSCTGFDGNEYELVFSDEFEVEGGRFGLVSFVSFFRFLRFFLPFLSVFIFVRRHDHSKRPRPAYRFLCVFALPSTYINCVISESLHPLFFRVRVLRGLSAARGCVPAIDAILFYFRSQRDDDSAVISFFIILAT